MEPQINPQSPYPAPQPTPSPPSHVPEAQVLNPSSSSSPQQQPSHSSNTGMFSGRLNRLGYLMSLVYIVLFFVVPVVLQLLFRSSGASGLRAVVNIITVLWGIASILLVLPVGISVGVRRWHDLNQSGFFVLLGFIPFVGFITLIIQLFVPGKQEPNNYGNPDTNPASIKKVLFGK